MRIEFRVCPVSPNIVILLLVAPLLAQLGDDTL